MQIHQESLLTNRPVLHLHFHRHRPHHIPQTELAMPQRVFLTYAPTNAASCKGCGRGFSKGDTKVIYCCWTPLSIWRRPPLSTVDNSLSLAGAVTNSFLVHILIQCTCIHPSPVSVPGCSYLYTLLTMPTGNVVLALDVALWSGRTGALSSVCHVAHETSCRPRQRH